MSCRRLTRWHRMQGDNTLWMPEHAGIATQAVVEKRLFELEATRHDVGREALVEKIWAWKDEYQERIIQQLLAVCDWKRARFTLDAVCARAVRQVFSACSGTAYCDTAWLNWDCHSPDRGIR